nr:retrovirus-related Pol polyprotein from transposon TNT 1-94 [Tanacetum cinerariifolium]
MDIIEFCGLKGIKKEYSNARTPQQNRVGERTNRTLIKAARTMLADSFLPNTFWTEAVSTACYILNRVLVTKPQNKTPYELLTDKIPIISYIRPFGCHVTILNTIDHLGKFEEKSDEGFLLGYSLSSKAFRPITVENKANNTASPKETNSSACTQDSLDAGNSEMEVDHAQVYYVLPLWSSYTSTVSSKAKNRDEKLHEDADSKTNDELTFAQSTKDLLLQARVARATSTNYVNTARTSVNAASTPLSTASTLTNQYDSQIPSLEDIYKVLTDGIFTSVSYDDEGAVVDFTNLETIVNVIGTKWVYRNKKDKRGVVVRNKARLVAQGHRQEEGIDYDEVFAPVAMIEAIRIFLAFTSYMGFIVYQIDVKSAFLYGKIDEEVYRRGLIDKTLFIKKDKKDIMLVQVYVDDIIFGSIKKSWCDAFEALMKNRFQMSSMGKLTFFLGLQVKQKEDGIFISHDKYVAEILKKFDFLSVKTASTPIETKKHLVKDEEAADLDVHLYRSMIGSLMYLTASRPDIMYAVFSCSRF